MSNPSSDKIPPEHLPSEEAAEGSETSSAETPGQAKDIHQELQEFRELALRKQAELENYRKRMIREKEDAIRYANSSVFEKLLPVIDSFELGLQAAKASSAPESVAIVEGFEMVRKQFLDFLRDHSVEQIDAAGESFDPNFHEAVSQQHDAEVPEGKVLHQIRKGYKLRDRLLRPSTVILSRGPAASDSQ